MVALLAALAVVAVLVGCSREQPEQRRTAPAAADYAQSLREKVTADAMFAHLQRLQQIADANGGNRAVGTPGNDASVEYIAKTLRDKGFDLVSSGVGQLRCHPYSIGFARYGAGDYRVDI